MPNSPSADDFPGSKARSNNSLKLKTSPPFTKEGLIHSAQWCHVLGSYAAALDFFRSPVIYFWHEPIRYVFLRRRGKNDPRQCNLALRLGILDALGASNVASTVASHMANSSL